MKKILFLVLAVSISFGLHAQTSKYEKAMTSTIAQIDTAQSPETIKKMANKFERIGNAEKDQWLPFYYQSLCYMRLAVTELIAGNMPATAPYVEKAQVILDKAKDLQEENSEIVTLQGWIYMGRIWEDPMTMGMQFGPLSTATLQKAMQLNPENPRPFSLMAQNLLYTPESFGGGPGVALPMFETAAEKFETFKPESNLHPNWGKEVNDYFITEAKKMTGKGND